jgi:hypothetical protein
MNSVPWPEGKSFAFTAFDDSDLATVQNVGAVYAFLLDQGFRTTKSVWPVSGTEDPGSWFGGSTCADEEYLDWAQTLHSSGFEIGFHNAHFHNAERSTTLESLQTFKDLFGHFPKSMANHHKASQNMYWGDERLTGMTRITYNCLTRFRNAGLFRGHVDGDPHFWGDTCRTKIKYVRNFVFPEINTLKACPFMPYHDPARPYVNYWFASSEGSDVDLFNECISEANQDRLEAEGGACIMYVHFAKGFTRDGRINARFESLMRRLSRKNGWFGPVSAVLDHLLGQNGRHVITNSERARLEWKWLLDRLKTAAKL